MLFLTKLFDILEDVMGLVMNISEVLTRRLLSDADIDKRLESMSTTIRGFQDPKGFYVLRDTKGDTYVGFDTDDLGTSTDFVINGNTYSMSAATCYTNVRVKPKGYFIKVVVQDGDVITYGDYNRAKIRDTEIQDLGDSMNAPPS